MKFIFILLLFLNLLYAGNDSITVDLNTSITVTKLGNVKKNSYDLYTINLEETGSLEIKVTGDDDVFFQFSSIEMPSAGDGTLTNNGPTLYNIGDTVYVSVNAPLQFLEQSYSITFTLLGTNTPPTDILLSSSSINENSSTGTTVGSFSTTDANPTDTHTYTLAGGIDDTSFSISGENLLSNVEFDYATKNLYTILVQTSDSHNETFLKEFNISITEGTIPFIDALQIFHIDESATNGTILGTVLVSNYPTSFSITNDGSDGNFTINNSGVITLSNSSNLDYNTTTSYTLGILASNDDGSDEKNITINVTDIIAPPDSNSYSCGMFGSVIVTYDHLDVSGTANAQACGTEQISYPSGQISGTIDCLTDIACGGTGASCERIDPPSNQLTYTWTHPDNPIINESPINPVPLTNIAYGNIAFSAGSAEFKATTINPNNNNKYMYIGDATFDQTLISFSSGDYYFESFSITKNKNDITNFVIDATNGPVRIFIKNNLSFDLNNLYLNHSGNPSELLIYVGGNLTNPSNGGGNTHMNAYFYVDGDVSLNNNSNNWIIEGGITAEGTITIAGNNPDFIQADESSGLGYGDCSMCYSDIVHSGISMGPMSMFYDIKVPILSSIETTNTTVTEIHKSIFSFSFMSTNDVTDQNNNHVSDAIETESGYTNGAMGMDMSLFSDKAITYPLGDYGASDRLNLHSSGMFDLSFGDWNNSLTYIGKYTDNEGRDYNVQLDPCQLTIATNEFSPAILDAVDTTCNTLLSCQDNNISTKIAGKVYDLNILDANSSSDMLFGVALIDATNSKTYYIGEVNATDNSGITSFTQEGINNNIPNNIASKDAWIQFYFCNHNSNWNSCWVVSGNTLLGGIDANESSSHDKFSIRPETFSIDLNSSDILKLKAGNNYLLDANATLYQLDTNSTGYNQILNNFADKNASIKLSPNSSTCTINDMNYLVATFSNGNYNTNSFTYDDVGDINITFFDKEWTAIDQANGGCSADSNSSSSSPYGCNIKTIKQVRFIPDHFTIQSSITNANNDNNFTYISDDLSQASNLDLIITAVNKNNIQTKNYTKECYAKDFNLSINYTTPSITPIVNSIKPINNIKYNVVDIDKNGTLDIDNTMLLTDLNNTLFKSDDNGSAKFNIKINFDRVKDKVVNPFIFNITDLNISDDDEVKGSKIEDKNSFFVYGRTHTTRQTFIGDSGSSNIHFEVYCYGNDCNKTLLKNKTSPNLKYTNDIRWFTNENHNASNDGVVGSVTQKYGNSITSSTPTTNNPASVIFNYNKNYGYPYKTTMQNNASSWLIYNKDDASTTKNYFQIEFIKIGEWTSKHETDTTTKNIGTAKINRRTMW